MFTAGVDVVDVPDGVVVFIVGDEVVAEGALVVVAGAEVLAVGALVVGVVVPVAVGFTALGAGLLG